MQKLKCLEVACSDERSGLVKIRQIVPGEVLDLDEASGETSGASCAVELDEAACPTARFCALTLRSIQGGVAGQTALVHVARNLCPTLSLSL